MRYFYFLGCFITIIGMATCIFSGGNRWFALIIFIGLIISFISKNIEK